MGWVLICSVLRYLFFFHAVLSQIKCFWAHNNHKLWTQNVQNLFGQMYDDLRQVQFKNLAYPSYVAQVLQVPELAGCGDIYISVTQGSWVVCAEISAGKRSSRVEMKMALLFCWAFLSLITVCIWGWITNQRSFGPAESQECRSCWVACWVISCLRGLLVVVKWSALSPKITSVPAGDGGAKLVGHWCSLPCFLPQRMLGAWIW